MQDYMTSSDQQRGEQVTLDEGWWSRGLQFVWKQMDTLLEPKFGPYSAPYCL